MLGDVVLCEFPFTSGVLTKLRPALVLFDLQTDLVICRITSVQYNGTCDVALSDWQAAGLLKPSVARLDRIITAEKSIVLRQLGRLSAGNLATVKSVWNTNMKL